VRLAHHAVPDDADPQRRRALQAAHPPGWCR
jgi:hypothetical protein